MAILPIDSDGESSLCGDHVCVAASKSQMPPCAAPRTICPLLGRIAIAPMRPLTALKIGVLRVTCTIGLGPIGAHVPLNTPGREAGRPNRSRRAAASAAARAAPACCVLSGLSPAVRRVSKKKSRRSSSASDSSSTGRGFAPGMRTGVSPVGRGGWAAAGAAASSPNASAIANTRTCNQQAVPDISNSLLTCAP